MKNTSILIVLFIALYSLATAQRLASPVIGRHRVPDDLLIKIAKTEDARDAAPVVAMLTNANAAVRYRAALAAGRIGDDKAVEGLISLLTDDSIDVRAIAAFAIGEAESAKGSAAIVTLLDDPKTPDSVRARAVEAAGKVAAANPRDPKSKGLGEAILDVLDAEYEKRSGQNRETILLGITAVLRARPNEGELVTAKFPTNTDPRIRAAAANTLARLRARNANPALRAMLLSETDAVARANAARALGAAEDKSAFDLLLDAATEDVDSRVRVSAIGSLASLKEAKAADRLLDHGKELLAAHVKSRKRNPGEKSELLVIAATLGRLIPSTESEAAIIFLNELRFNDDFASPETEVAFARIAPKAYLSTRLPAGFGHSNHRTASAYAQGIGEIANSTDASLKLDAARKINAFAAGISTGGRASQKDEIVKALPDVYRALAGFKPEDIGPMMREALINDDANVRAATAGLIAGQPPSKENIEALKKALDRAFLTDSDSDDAVLAIMGALFRLDKKGSAEAFLVALDSPNYLVRKRAFEILADPEIRAASPGVSASLETARSQHKDRVLQYSPALGTKLGQILSTDADYRRALTRRNGSVKAVLTTEKGTFTIDFFPENAPLTVDNFVKLARTGYFNGLEVHRVVPNFVMQDGDPRGDGSGGPGWSIRCEVNTLPYDRGAVGMALSGKDTGGSQWFVTHSPQPHLDGGYTVFGRVNTTGMKVVDNIVRGDKIVSVRIVEGNLRSNTRKTRE